MSDEQPEPWSYEPVPQSAIRLFRLVWQLEAWMRSIAYVEFRAARVDWEEPLRQVLNKDWPPRSMESDKKLHHMATSHRGSLSYLTFGQLWSVISVPSNWPLFEPYFPPKANTEIKIEEVKAIRNRVAHFREPHANDEKRLRLFLEDLEPGFRRFCIRYTAAHYIIDAADDPVTERLAESWERVGYGIELSRPNGGWLYAPGRHRNDPLMNARLCVHKHRNSARGSLEGVIYRVTFSCHPRPNDIGTFDAGGFANATLGLHDEIIHLVLTGREPSVTIPAIQGIDATAELIADFLQSALDHRSRVSHHPMERADWPEYVLWPNDMLAFFCEEMRESVIDLG